jgi:hypothetical protein
MHEIEKKRDRDRERVCEKEKDRFIMPQLLHQKMIHLVDQKLDTFADTDRASGQRPQGFSGQKDINHLYFYNPLMALTI